MAGERGAVEEAARALATAETCLAWISAGEWDPNGARTGPARLTKADMQRHARKAIECLRVVRAALAHGATCNCPNAKHPPGRLHAPGCPMRKEDACNCLGRARGMHKQLCPEKGRAADIAAAIKTLRTMQLAAADAIDGQPDPFGAVTNAADMHRWACEAIRALAPAPGDGPKDGALAHGAGGAGRRRGPAVTACDVCLRRVIRRTQALVMCGLCQRSFDRMNRRDSTHAGLILWAVRRARRFAKRPIGDGRTGEGR